MNILKTAAASRAARLTAVAGLVGASIVGLSSTAEAANTAATVTPSTGKASTAVTLSAKGKGFRNAADTAVLTRVRFQPGECTSTVGGTAATDVVAMTATTASFKTPTLNAGTYYVCFYDGSAGTANILGEGKYTTGTVPSFTSQTASSFSSSGGTSTTITGANFTKATKVYVDGIAAKSTYVNATTLTAVLPAHASGSADLTIQNEYGSSTPATAISYDNTLTISPAYGDGTAGRIVSIKGSGFSSLSFGTNTSDKAVAFIPAGAAAGDDISSSVCSVLAVLSNTQLSCVAPALADGAYGVVVVTRDASTATNIGSIDTPISRSAIYISSDY